MKKLFITAAGAALLLAAAQSSFAASPRILSNTITYSATMVGACTTLTLSAPSIDLGNYSTTQTGIIPVNPAGSISVDCPAGTDYYIAIDRGNHTTAAAAYRKIADASGGFIPYDLKYTGTTVGDDLPAGAGAAKGAYGAATFTGRSPITGITTGGLKTYGLTVDLHFVAADGYVAPTVSPATLTDTPIVSVVW